MGLGPGISSGYLIREQGDTGAVNEDIKAKELEAANRKLRRGRSGKIYDSESTQVLWHRLQGSMKQWGWMMKRNDCTRGKS